MYFALAGANTAATIRKVTDMKTQTMRDAKLVVVIDDDPLVLEATAGLLSSWGCEVVTAATYGAALDQLTGLSRRPDLIICDYRLSEGSTGVDVIEGLRSIYEIPALLISGDPLLPDDGEKPVGGYCLLQKPFDATRFRAALIGASVLQG
jgi:CheY-like chemotaxis protein